MNIHRRNRTLTAEAARMRALATFEDFTDDQLERIAGVGRPSSLPNGWPLMREQTPSDACYVILDGEVDVYYGRQQVARLQRGDIVGEAVLHPGELRAATVSAVGPVDLLHIDRDDFARLLDEVPPLRTTIEAIAARHTTSTQT